jgi:hypothetical protein
MVAMKRTKVADAIFLVRFETQYGLASTFLRFQEHFESRRFAGRIFTLEAFMDWYAAEHGRFTYYEDWSGFNVPSAALAPFREGRFDPLLEKERRLLELFRHEPEPFYVIGVTVESTRDELWHELAHALYFTNSSYRTAVKKAMADHETSALARRLYEAGYSKRVLPDEVHAYVLTGPGSAFRATAGAKLKPLRRALRTVFKAHGGNELLAATLDKIRRAGAP